MGTDKRRKIFQCCVVCKIKKYFQGVGLLTAIEVRDVCRWYSDTIPARSLVRTKSQCLSEYY
jgi:hypothetical protein